MNEKPHIHEISIRDSGTFWSIGYGDQPRELPDKLRKNANETDKEYEEKNIKLIRMTLEKMIKNHDRQSILAGQGLTITQLAIPRLVDGYWGSEQLNSPIIITNPIKSKKSFLSFLRK